MKNYLLLSFLTFSLLSCEKDPPIPEQLSSEFQLNIGGANDDFGKSLLEMPNGDIYAVGSTQSYGAGQKDVFVIKTDTKGNIIWTKTFGGAANDEANEIILTTDGMLLIAGTTASFGAGGNDVYLIKLDTAGTMLWQQQFGGSADESAEDVVLAADGNFMISGITSSFGNGLRDAYLLKVNAAGTLIWSKTYGGALDDGAISICNADAGNMLLFGFSDNFPAVARDMIVIKINTAGDSLNSWLYGGSDYEQAVSIEPTADGNFILSGHTASFGHIDHNMYCLKISGIGHLLWEKNYGGDAHDGVEHGRQCNDGGYIFAGRTVSFANHFEQMYLLKTDEAGNMEWQKNIGGIDDDAAYNIVETKDHFILVGNTKSITNGNNDVFLVKIKKQ